MKNELVHLSVRALTWIGFLVMIVGMPTKTAHAAANCIAASTGNWSTITWTNCPSQPQSGDSVFIYNDYSVTLDTNASVATVYLGETGGNLGIGNSTGTLTMSGNNQLTVSGTIYVGGDTEDTHTGLLTWATGASGATLTAGTVQFGGLGTNNRSTGTINMTNGGILSTGNFVIGTVGSGSHTWTPGTGTVQLTATNTLPNTLLTTFTHLTINGGTTTMGVALTVNGNMTINSGATFDVSASNYGLSLKGNFSNTGTFAARTGTVTIAGSSGTQTLSGSITFYNLTLNNSGATTDLGSSQITIANTLSKTAGVMTAGTGTVTFTGASGSIIGSGSKSFYNLVINNGAIITTASTTGNNINIQKDFTNNGTFSQSAGLITYFIGTDQKLLGSGPTTLGSVTVQGTSTVNAGSHNLIIGGSSFSVSSGGVFNGGTATVVFNASTTLYGTGTLNFNNVTINSTKSLINNVNNKNFNVAGIWMNNGTYTPGTETVTFNGNSTQSIGGSAATTFGKLTLSNSSDACTVPAIALGSNIAVNNTLTLSSSLMTTSVYVLDMTGATSTSGMTGDVLGNVKRTDIGATERAFGSPSTTIALTLGSASAITVTLLKPMPTAANFANAVNRLYSINTADPSGISATLKLHYRDDGSCNELNSNAESSLTLWQYDSPGPWTDRVYTSRDGTNNFVSLGGVSSFSSWALSVSGPANSTPITLASIEAYSGGPDLTLVALGLLVCSSVVIAIGVRERKR